MSFLRLLIAWVLSMAIYAAIIQAWYTAKGRPPGGFASGMLETLGGLGILLAIPTLLFALIIAWPAMTWLGLLRPAWLVPVLGAAVLSMVMWALARVVLPNGWVGVEQTLVGYAAILGMVWGCLNFVASRAV